MTPPLLAENSNDAPATTNLGVRGQLVYEPTGGAGRKVFGGGSARTSFVEGSGGAKRFSVESSVTNVAKLGRPKPIHSSWSSRILSNSSWGRRPTRRPT